MTHICKQQPSILYKIERYLLCSLLVFISPINIAQTPNKPEAIHVSANSAKKNTKTGTTTYQGKVIITQGGLRLTGNSVTIYDQQGELSHIIAKGSPAQFTQKSPNTDTLQAKANTVTYHLKNETLDLRGNASLAQDGRTTSSNKITYDMKTAVVNAGGDTGRVIMVLPPPTK